MSQPWSGYNNWLEDPIQLNSALPLTEDPMAIDNTGQIPSYKQEEYISFRGNLDFEQESEGKTWDKDSEVVTNYFPQPPLALEEGYTFINLFNADKNSIYCLSMGKINDFLALEMISDKFDHHYDALAQAALRSMTYLCLPFGKRYSGEALSDIYQMGDRQTCLADSTAPSASNIIVTPESNLEMDLDANMLRSELDSENIIIDLPQLEMPEDPLHQPFSELIGSILGTSRRDKEKYIMKDHWILGHKDAMLNEVNMLQEMKGVHGMLELVEYYLLSLHLGKSMELWKY
ncbi:hypothetical protein BDR06DRAFT_977791 [Suillus hirtellus]|nr:hypothetical protein BDR06DRAFT_977791 [Suillus hirtellus]